MTKGKKDPECFDCAYCSESYPSLEDYCDLTVRKIHNVFEECCESFIESFIESEE